MSEITIFCRASDRSQSAMFEATLKRFDLTPVIDSGQECFNDVHTTFERAIRAVEECPTKFAMFTDAFDVLMVRWNEAEIIRDVLASQGGVILAGEPNCWPPGPWCAAYKPLETPWGYICGGQCVGTKEAVLNLLKAVYERRDTVVAGGGNQEIMHRMLAEGYPITIDQYCGIFQCMNSVPSDFIRCRDNKAYNMATHTWPMLLHFNGKTPGIEEWYRRIM